MNITFAAALAYVVLIPGAGSSGDRLWLHHLNGMPPILGGDRYFGKLEDDLAAAGIAAIVCPSDQDEDMRNIEERAEKCVADILAREKSCGQDSVRRVHVVGHSMGGLVARTVAQDPRVERCIGSVTLVSTPNHGTPIADWAFEHAAEVNASFDFLKSRYIPQVRVDHTGYPESVFRAQNLPDNPDFPYFSLSSSMKKIPLPPLSVSQRIIAEELHRRGLDQTSFGAANDGVIPEYSMIRGTYLGHVESHHFASGCSDVYRNSAGCHRVAEVLLRHLGEVIR